MKILKSVRIITALVLIIACIAVAPINTAEAANTGKYVSEVYLAYGKDADSAKKTLEDKGFTPVEGNLNDGGTTYVMMGYKTTDDIRESITDLAVMNMNGNYSVEDYKTLLKTQKTQIAEFLTEFISVIKEYRANLKAGKTKATYVHDLLNNYVDDDTGMRMGDLLNSETLQDKVGIEESIDAKNPDKLPDLITILLQGNVQIVKSMEVLLSMAADTAENTWLDRFAELDYDTLLDQVEDERPELNTESKRVQYLDNVYGETAGALGVEVLNLRNELLDYEASDFHIDTATEEDIEKMLGDVNEDVDASAMYQNWLMLGTIYEGLKNYEGGNFAKGEMLEFFLNADDPDDSEIFIPMSAALSEGQRYGIPFVSLTQLMTYAFTSEEGWKEYADQSAADFDGLDSISVFQNIDRDLYKDDGTVALTDSAQRANNTADGTTGSVLEKIDTLSAVVAVGWIATAGLGMATVKSFQKSKDLMTAYYTDPFKAYDNPIFDSNQYEKIINNQKSAYEVAIKRPWATGDELTFYETRYTYPLQEENATDKLARLNSARFSVSITYILTLATVAVAVVTAYLTVMALLRDENIEQLPIPKYLVDNYTNEDGGSYPLNYKAVECNRMEYFGRDYKKQKGNCADINADEGKQWLVLYASKNSMAGKPITPDFVVQTSNQAPTGYEGSIHLIGEKGAVNVVSGAFKNYSSFSKTWQNITGSYTMYVFSKLSKTAKTYDASAGNMTATSMSGGMTALIGFGGLALGTAIGIVGTVLVNKNKKKKEAA